MSGKSIFKRRRRRAFTLRLFLLFFAALSAAFLLLMNYRINPILRELAVSKVSNHTSLVINETVNEKISSGELDYDDMIYFEKDTDGAVTALKTNMSTMNRLRTELLTLITRRVSDASTSELSVPIGNVLPSSFFSGRGPGIPMRVLSVSSPNAAFRSDFSEAGINQTRHRIMMDIEMYVTVLLPSCTASTVVTSEICVAETVLVGAVPGSYAYFENTDTAEEALEDYLNTEMG